LSVKIELTSEEWWFGQELNAVHNLPHSYHDTVTDEKGESRLGIPASQDHKVVEIRNTNYEINENQISNEHGKEPGLYVLNGSR
jgi:hypothetical protein